MFVERSEQGDYPVFQGKNIHQFAYNDHSHYSLASVSLWGIESDDPEESAQERVRMKSFRSNNPNVGLKKAIYTKFNGTGSQRPFVNDLLERNGRPKLSPEDVLSDFTEYRIGIRNVANVGNERTLIATALPKDAVVVDTICTIRPYFLNPEEEDLSEYPVHSAYEYAFSSKEMFVLLGLGLV